MVSLGGALAVSQPAHILTKARVPAGANTPPTAEGHTPATRIPDHFLIYPLPATGSFPSRPGKCHGQGFQRRGAGSGLAALQTDLLRAHGASAPVKRGALLSYTPVPPQVVPWAGNKVLPLSLVV